MDHEQKCQIVSSKVPHHDHHNRKTLLDHLKSDKEKIINCRKNRGNQNMNLIHSTRDIHLKMRENYKRMIHDCGNYNIYPLMIANDGDDGFAGVGGSFTLYERDGSVTRVIPEKTHLYELMKHMGHIPLGIWSIIGGYFDCPRSINWKHSLQEYLSLVESAIFAHKQFDKHSKPEVSEEKLKRVGKILDMTKDYCQDLLAESKVTMEKYKEFCDEIYPLVKKCMLKAAEIQVKADFDALLEWKPKLVERGIWNDLYFIIPVVWPVAGECPRAQLIKRLMDPTKVDTHCIFTENDLTLEEARTTLGRVVVDRGLAQVIFGDYKNSGRGAFCFALSTKRDLMSDASDAAWERLYGEHCKKVHSAPEEDEKHYEDVDWEN